jgi:hypothetical protein
MAVSFTPLAILLSPFSSFSSSLQFLLLAIWALPRPHLFQILLHIAPPHLRSSSTNFEGIIVTQALLALL